MTTATGNIAAGTRVLVTGATGFTGSVLTRKLVEAGVRVNAIARPSSAIDTLKDLDIQWFRGDVFDPETVRRACEGVEYVFHLAAAYRQAKASDAMYEKVHVASTQLLANAVLEKPSFKCFVHVSTVGVHGHIDRPPADENYAFTPGDIYQKTKADAELWLRHFAEQKHLPFVVIRPCAIFGPGDRRLLKIFRMAARGYLLVLGRGRCLYHLVHVEDLTNMILLSATCPSALGEVLIAGNTDSISLMRMGEILASHFGRKLHIIRLPVQPFFLLAAVCEAVCRPLGIEPPLYRRRVAFYTKDRAFSTRKIGEKLAYHYVYTNETGLQQTAQWYQDQGWIK